MLNVTPVAALVLCIATGLAFAQQPEEPKQPAAEPPQEKEQPQGEQAATQQPQRPAQPQGDASPEEKKAPAEPADDGQSPEDRVSRALLERALPEVTFDGVGLTDVIDFLRDVTNANVFVNWRALEGAGIDRNAPVTARMKNVKFGKALAVVLDGASGQKGKLAFEIGEGVITISTAEDLGKNTHTRVYDVRDLLRPAADGADAAQAKRLAALTKLITGSIAPETWPEKGGSTGAIRELDGQLIITQAPAQQDAIANLLNQTRALMGLEPVDQPAQVLREAKE